MSMAYIRKKYWQGALVKNLQIGCLTSLQRYAKDDARKRGHWRCPSR